MAKLGCCEGSGSVNDAVCSSISIVSEEDPISIWTNETSFMINGTILVENKGLTGAPTAELLINGSTTSSLDVEPGESKAITLDNLMSIGVQGSTGGTGTSPVKVSYSLNYTF